MPRAGFAKTARVRSLPAFLSLNTGVTILPLIELDLTDLKYSAEAKFTITFSL